MKSIWIGYLETKADSIGGRDKARREHLNFSFCVGSGLVGIEVAVNLQPLRSTLRQFPAGSTVRHHVSITTEIVMQAKSVSKFMSNRLKIKTIEAVDVR